MAISELRREYNLTGLRREDLAPEPLAQFRLWFEQAAGSRRSGRVLKFFVGVYKSLLGLKRVEQIDVNAMTLATVNQRGEPSARVVLLKGASERGFIFYTNYNSRKGRELAQNPHAAVVFYWPELERQVCAAGTVSKVSAEESDAYFRSRPRGSWLAAWASNQSEPVPNRATLEERWAMFEKQYPGPDVPRPPHWGGYVLTPERVEFWQGRPNRLHDRFVYTRQTDGTWRVERLCP